MFLALDGQTQTESENMEMLLWLGKLAHVNSQAEHAAQNDLSTRLGLITSPTLTQPTPNAASAHFVDGLECDLAH